MLKVQADFGGPCNRHSAKLILKEVSGPHGRKAAERLIRAFRPEIFDFVVEERLP